ncbi:MAG: sulfite exporter TauE/SafE family protein [Calditerrivibrio sp.]|nr:sulfite exporter TauE/SafE family protein [Calditerrivibrio sp.]
MIKIFILFVVGVITGFINVLGGGGSFLTLPILIFLGLPATIANGTNRLGILLQNISAIYKYISSGHFPLKFALAISLPVVLGSVTGAKIAVVISDKSFTKYLAIFMFVITILTIFNPTKRLDFKNRYLQGLAALVIFFLIGIYGGFIQAGVGFLLLAGTTLLGYDLLKGNAVKVFIVFILTIAALPVFILSKKIDYGMGLALGTGNLVGGMIAASVSIKKGEKFIKNFVTASIIIFSILLLVTG